MPLTIEAPTTRGGHVELTGDVVGSFLLHKSTHMTFIDDAAKYLWRVTHVATGMAFPWQFYTKNSARAFAKDVEKLVDWSAVKVEMRADDPWNVKGRWIAGAPLITFDHKPNCIVTVSLPEYVAKEKGLV